MSVIDTGKFVSAPIPKAPAQPSIGSEESSTKKTRAGLAKTTAAKDKMRDLLFDAMAEATGHDLSIQPGN